MTDAELQAKLNKWFNKMNRHIDDELDSLLFKNAHFYTESDGTRQSMSADLFKQKFQGKRYDDIVNVLEEQLKPSYFWKIDYNRKENIVKMLYAMGLDEDARMLNKLGIRKFHNLYKTSQWDFVKEIYGENKSILIAEQVSASAGVKTQDEIHNEIKEMDIGKNEKYKKMQEIKTILGW